MTADAFANWCNTFGILPELALENQAIRDALFLRDDSKVINLLDEEF